MGLILCCAATGCTLTTIEPQAEPAAEFAALEQANTAAIGLSIAGDDEPLSLGHQYLLLAIPFGRIELSRPPVLLRQSASAELALKGYRPFPMQSLPAGARTLKLEPLEISLSAYDFLFFRRIVCRLEIKGTLYSADGAALREYSISHRHSDYRQFAFRPQLEYVLNSALAGGLRDLFAAMMI